MSGTNQNFNAEQWARHLESQRKAQRRHTPILDKQAKNDPFGKKK